MCYSSLGNTVPHRGTEDDGSLLFAAGAVVLVPRIPARIHGRYELTWKPFEIGARFARSKGIGEQTGYAPRCLADESRESAKLGVWERQEILVLYIAL
jgi:hypothetical protein